MPALPVRADTTNPGVALGGGLLVLFAQAVSRNQNIVDTRDGRERKGCVEKKRFQVQHPRHAQHLCQDNEENSRDLTTGVQLAINAGPEVAKPDRGIQNDGGGHDAQVAAEHQAGVLPRDLLDERKHEKQRTQQQLVGDWIQILPQHGLLVQGPCQQSVEGVAQGRRHQKTERPNPLSVEYRHDDKRDEDQAQERDLVRRSPELTLQAATPKKGSAIPRCSTRTFPVYLPNQSRHRWRTAATNRQANEGQSSASSILTALSPAGNHRTPQNTICHGTVGYSLPQARLPVMLITPGGSRKPLESDSSDVLLAPCFG